MTNIHTAIENPLDYMSNPIYDTDGYKPSHWLQYPKDNRGNFFYLASRGGLYDRTMVSGFQYIIRAYLSRQIKQHHLEDARDFLPEYGVPCNIEDWQYIIDRYDGYLPLRIRAIPEGTVVTTHNPLLTCESTDERLGWLPSYFEDTILRAWYPTTVATISWDIKQILRKALHQTSDDPEGQLPFKLHDFGARGATSLESAAIGGAAHLGNFLGTDTIMAVRLLKAYYFAKTWRATIAASEHSTITSWGRENEVEAYRNMLKVFGREGTMFACVSDSYDIYNAITNLWGGELRQQVIDSGATLVIRPDSGDPIEVVSKCLDLCAEAFGFTVNSKGYSVLNNVRIIQGDGVNPASIAAITKRVVASKYSMDNLAFGMGGALIQKCDRDTQKFAFKCSATKFDDGWHDTFKDPIDDKVKTSLKGRVNTYRHKEYGTFRTFRYEDQIPIGYEDAMKTIYHNGQVHNLTTLDDIRALSNRYTY